MNNFAMWKSFWARVVSRWIHILFQLVPPQSHSIFYSLSTISFWINITFIFQHVVKKYHIYSEWGKWESFVNKIGFFLSHPQVVYNLWLFSFFNSTHNFTHSSISHLSASNYHYLDRISFFSLYAFLTWNFSIYNLILWDSTPSRSRNKLK